MMQNWRSCCVDKNSLWIDISEHFWLNGVADRGKHTVMLLIFPDHWTKRGNHQNEVCDYEEACGSKKVSLRRTKQELSCETHWVSEPCSIPGNMPKWKAPHKCGRSWTYRFFSKCWFCSSQCKPICMQGRHVKYPGFKFCWRWFSCILKTNCGSWLLEDRLTKDYKTTVALPKLFFSEKILSPNIMWWDKTSGWTFNEEHIRSHNFNRIWKRRNRIYSQDTTNTIPSKHPFEFKHFQFVVKLCFAMINSKSQGQSL
jgi:hypothetical protein